MKKRSVKYLLLFFLMLPLFAENAKVTFVKGKVEVLKDSKWEPVTIGQELCENSVLSTGFNSEVRIQYKGTVMGLGPLTRITLEKLADTEKKEIVNVYLNTGSVRSKITHPQDKRVSQTVRNAISVCSVRGTDYIFYDNGKVVCFSGAVATFPAFMLDEKFYMQSFADNSELETEFEEDVEEVPEESATATTESEDIADFAPPSAVVVAGGQAATVNETGNIEKPITNNNKEFNKLNSGFTTLAESEKVSVSQVPVVEPSGETPVLPVPSSASVEIIVNLPNSASEE